MHNAADMTAESAVLGPYVSYDDVARFEYGQRLWRDPEMRQRLLAYWLDVRHPHHERFAEWRALIESILVSTESVVELDRYLRERGTSLRCIASEIPPVFGQWFTECRRKK